MKYFLTFKEEGLPTGTNWSVTVGLTTLWSTLTYIPFPLPNGSYSYKVANVANYSGTPTGTVTVAGRGVTVVEVFSAKKDSVTLKEDGPPNLTVEVEGQKATVTTHFSLQTPKVGATRFEFLPSKNFQGTPGLITKLAAGTTLHRNTR